MKNIILSLIPLTAILILPACTTVVQDPVPAPRTSTTTVEETTHIRPLSGSTTVETHSTRY